MMLEHVAALQTESSLSWRCELDASQRTLSKRPSRDVLVHQAPQSGGQRAVVPVHQCLSHNHDAHNTLNARRRTHNDSGEGASCGYHPRHGGSYDSGEDRSLSPSLPGP